jgi:predicted RNA-binding Zn-ribbon protein involved in translation (DUF1610 family)
MVKLMSNCPSCNRSSDVLENKNITECPLCGYNFVMECCRRLQTDFRKCENCEAKFKCWSQSKLESNQMLTNFK